MENTNEITIHRALAQIKTTEARITEILDRSKFVSVTVGNSGVANGKSVKSVSSDIVSDYDKVLQLIKNIGVLKRAIIVSNSGINAYSVVDKVTVKGTEMTLSEMLSLNSYVLPYYEQLLKKLVKQYNEALANADYSRSNAQTQINRMLANMGTSEEKVSKEVIESLTETYNKNNATILVDPLHIEDKIKNLREFIETFKEEVDAILSESNATKKISVDFENSFGF